MTTPITNAASPAATTAVRRPAQPADPARIAKAAEDFTAVALGEMLKPIFETTDHSDGLFGGGEGEKTWRPMMVDEIAKAIAHQGGLGLNGPVTQAMLQMQEKAS
jgi:Rod binding domain-containing protein